MAASQADGQMTHWFRGLPYPGIYKSGQTVGQMQYWFRGLPYGMIFLIPASGPANLKTFDGVVKANIKTIDGVAIGSVKSVNGVI